MDDALVAESLADIVSTSSRFVMDPASKARV